MSMENEEMYEEQQAEQEEQQEEQQPEKKSSNRDIESIVSMRMKQKAAAHQAEKEEKERKIRELQEENRRLREKGSESTKEKDSIPVDQIPELIRYREEVAEFGKKLDTAIEEDSEFKSLAEKSAHGGALPPELLAEMRHLENGVAVVKHLLKNKKDYSELRNIINETNSLNGRETRKFLRELDDKLDKTLTKPGESEYEAPPDFSDAGESGEDFDFESYRKQKLRQR